MATYYYHACEAWNGYDLESLYRQYGLVVQYRVRSEGEIVKPNFDDNCWEVQYAGAHAAELKALFGTDTLPTLYSLEVPGCKVAEEIAKQRLYYV